MGPRFRDSVHSTAAWRRARRELSLGTRGRGREVSPALSTRICGVVDAAAHRVYPGGRIGPST